MPQGLAQPSCCAFVCCAGYFNSVDNLLVHPHAGLLFMGFNDGGGDSGATAAAPVTTVTALCVSATASVAFGGSEAA